MKFQKKTAKAAVGCLLLLLLYGCASDRITVPGQDVSGVTESDGWELTGTDTDVNADGSDEAPTSSQKSAQNDTSDIVETDNTQTTSAGAKRLTVYVCGAVQHPGVYELAEGSRVYETLALAGGVTDDASPTAVNQAQLLTDGEMIEILTVDEAMERETAQETESDGRVNINTADAEELKTLPGIGEAKADSIIAYREKNGAFAAIGDIKNIEGIKDGVFAKLEDHIKVE